MGDGQDKISLRQVMAIFAVGILSPVIKVFPGQSAAVSGKGTWVAPLFAVLPMLALFGLMHVLLRRANGRHLGEIYCDIFGNWLGKALAGLYLLWAFLLMCITVRDYSDRFLATTYQDENLVVFSVILLAFVFVTARGSLRAFGRLGELCLAILLVVLFLVIAFSFSGSTELQRVIHIGISDVGASIPSVLPCISMLGLSVYSGFLWPQFRLGQKRDRARLIGWLMAFCVILSVLQIAILSAMGVELTPHLQYPIFYMVKDSAVLGVFERLEAIVVALWVAADYLFVGSLAILSAALLKFLFGLKSAKEMVTPILLLVFAGSLVIASNSTALQTFSATVARGGNVVLCFGVPAVAAAVGKVRKKL